MEITATEIRLARATTCDVEELTALEAATFKADVAHAADRPLGYDCPGWHRETVATSYFYKIMVAGRVVGGAVVRRPEWSHFHLARIWVAPTHQGRGVGARTLALLEARFPQATLWTVEAPAWAHRRRHFYKTGGYRPVHAKDGVVRYEKPRRGRLRFDSFARRAR